MEFMAGGSLTDILEVFPTIQMTEGEIALMMLEVHTPTNRSIKSTPIFCNETSETKSS